MTFWGKQAMQVRTADNDDCEDLFVWRNDEFTRRMSLNSHPIDWRAHCDWFNSALADESRVVLICEERGGRKKIAVVRFDIVKQTATVSINLAPEQRGRGKATGCLQGAIDFLLVNRSDVTQLAAEVREDNQASARCFANAGFALLSLDGGVLRFQRKARLAGL